MKLYLLLILAPLCAPVANAQSLSCSVTTTPVNFGNANMLGGPSYYDNTGSVALNCSGTGGLTFTVCIELTMGTTNSQGRRLIYDGSATVPVQLFQDFRTGNHLGNVGFGTGGGTAFQRRRLADFVRLWPPLQSR